MINVYETFFEARECKKQLEKIYHGETVDLVGRITTDGIPMHLNGYSVSGIYQPTASAGDTRFYELSADIVDSEKVVVHWQSVNDWGDSSYTIWALVEKGSEESYPLSWRIDMAYSPSWPFEPQEDLKPKTLEFADLVVHGSLSAESMTIGGEPVGEMLGAVAEGVRAISGDVFDESHGLSAIKEAIDNIHVDVPDDIATSGQVAEVKNGVDTVISDLRSNLYGFPAISRLENEINNRLKNDVYGLPVLKDKLNTLLEDASGVSGILIDENTGLGAISNTINAISGDTSRISTIESTCNSILADTSTTIPTIVREIDYNTSGLRDGMHPLNSAIAGLDYKIVSVSGTEQEITDEIHNQSHGLSAIKDAIDNIHVDFPTDYATSTQAQTMDSKLNEIIAKLDGAPNPPPDFDKPFHFIDKNGALLYSYTNDEISALSALPPLPYKDGYICEGWNYTSADLQSQRSYIEGGTIGAVYKSNDDKLHLFVQVDRGNETVSGLCFYETENGGGTIDWGDGTTETPTGMLNTHTYASAASATVYEITFAPSQGVVNFSGSLISGYTEDTADDATTQWSARAAQIKEIRIPYGVTALPNCFFANMTQIESVNIPSTVTSIGYMCFHNCISLRGVVVPAGCAFGSVGGASRAFSNTRALEQISFPPTWSGSTTQVIYQNLVSLKRLAFPYSLRSKTTLGSFWADGEQLMFKRCYFPPGITAQNCPPFANSAIEEFVWKGTTQRKTALFQNCKSLKKFEWRYGGSITVGDLFGQDFVQGCDNLAEVVLPEQLKTIPNRCMDGSKALSYFKAPSSTNRMGSPANCPGLKVLDLSNVSSVPSFLGNALTGCPPGMKIIVPDSLYDSFVSDGGWSAKVSAGGYQFVKASEA